MADGAGDIVAVETDAQFAVLGAAMFEPECIPDLPLRPEHFLEPTCGRIWEAVTDLAANGRGTDPVVVHHALKADPGLASLGGMGFLVDLLDHAPPASKAPHFAAVVLDQFQRHRVEALAHDTGARIKCGDQTSEVIAELEQGLSDLARDGPDKGAWQSVSSVVSQAVDRAKTSTGMGGLSTGLRDLDDVSGGLRKGQMIILGGRPGMAKSSAALNIARAVSQQGRGVAFFSMEMPDHDLGLRVACDIAHDPFWARSPHYFTAEKGRLDTDQWAALDEAVKAAGTLPIAFDARPGLTVPQMLSATRRRFREWERQGVEPGLVVVDHLLLARADRERQGNKVAETGDVSRGLAEMAKILDVPVLALCQLNRAVEGRGTDRRPSLADLKWSGDLEADARLVMFLYRPEYYVRKPEDANDPAAEIAYREKLERVKHKLFWLVEKNNNGPTGEVETYCNIAASAIRNRMTA